MSGWHTYVVNIGTYPKKIDIRRGIFQGDKMSPTLFCVALSILKEKVNPRIEDDRSINWTTKICYMDDIKIFGASIGAVEASVGKIKRLGKMLGRRVNHNKSALVTKEPAGRLAFTEHLREFPLVGSENNPEYKYLGFKQVWVNTRTTKDEMLIEAKRRIRKICGSNLTIINTAKQLKISVAPLITYIAQAMVWKQSELDQLNRFVRLRLKITGVLPWRICNGRLYTDPSRGGFGIPNFVEQLYIAVCGTLRYMQHQIDTRDETEYDVPMEMKAPVFIAHADSVTAQIEIQVEGGSVPDDTKETPDL
jgi:hypothetical protein